MDTYLVRVKCKYTFRRLCLIVQSAYSLDDAASQVNTYIDKLEWSRENIEIYDVENLKNDCHIIPTT